MKLLHEFFNVLIKIHLRSITQNHSHYKIILLQWHGLSREEQAKYYDQARKERQLHMQMYPGWSARDNYAQNKKKSRKQLQREKNANCSLNNGSMSDDNSLDS